MSAVRPGMTYRCAACGQLLPFDQDIRVPEACLHRCEGACDWDEVGTTTADVRTRAAVEGPVGADGLPDPGDA